MSRPIQCPCGSGEYCEPLYDARGIFCSYVCDECEDHAKKEFKPSVFTDSQYECCEPVEPEEY